MIYSRNIVSIFFLIAHLDNMMSESPLDICVKNIYSSFDYGNEKPRNVRIDLPRRAFFNKVIVDFTNDVAKNYFEHLHNTLIHKETMQLPRRFCDNKTKRYQYNNDDKRITEFTKCSEQLCSLYLDSNDKTSILRDVFWRFKESFFNDCKPKDYVYEYFIHLSSKLKYHCTKNKRRPLTPKEFCIATIKNIEISSMETEDVELSTTQDADSCTDNIFRDFGLTDRLKQYRARTYLPTIAFTEFIEDDLDSVDAKDYFNHIYNLIKAKDGTENPRKYCDTITQGLNIKGVDIKLQEERKCLGHLISLFIDSDTTTVLRNAFLNFKHSDFSGSLYDEFRYNYFYYLSGNFDFYNSDVIKRIPLSPAEFCRKDRNEVLNIRMPIESGSKRGEGSSSSNTFKKVSRIEDLL